MEQKMKNQQHITVNTAEGQLAGSAEGEIAVFKGILTQRHRQATSLATTGCGHALARLP